jgi:hypothetical protein
MTCKEMTSGCKGCVYYFNIHHDTITGCDFYLSTGERRGCPSANCNRKKLGKKKKPILPIFSALEGRELYI